MEQSSQLGSASLGSLELGQVPQGHAAGASTSDALGVHLVESGFTSNRVVTASDSLSVQLQDDGDGETFCRARATHTYREVLRVGGLPTARATHTYREVLRRLTRLSVQANDDLRAALAESALVDGVEQHAADTVAVAIVESAQAAIVVVAADGLGVALDDQGTARDLLTPLPAADALGVTLLESGSIVEHLTIQAADTLRVALLENSFAIKKLSIRATDVLAVALAESAAARHIAPVAATDDLSISLLEQATAGATNPGARVTQNFAEFAWSDDPGARLTQGFTEHAWSAQPHARLTQNFAEVNWSDDPHSRFTQGFIEVLTPAPQVCDGVTLDFTAVFSGWLAEGGSQQLKVAGPGSVVVPSTCAWFRPKAVDGGGWLVVPADGVEGWMARSTTVGDVAAFIYSCQHVHDLYLGALLGGDQGSVSAVLDGSAPVALALAPPGSGAAGEAAQSGRLLVASSVPAGTHRLALEVATAPVQLDHVQAAVPSDVWPPAPAGRLHDVGFACSMDDDLPGKVSPARLLWLASHEPPGGRIDVSVGSTWQFRRVRVGPDWLVDSSGTPPVTTEVVRWLYDLSALSVAAAQPIALAVGHDAALPPADWAQSVGSTALGPRSSFGSCDEPKVDLATPRLLFDASQSTWAGLAAAQLSTAQAINGVVDPWVQLQGVDWWPRSVGWATPVSSVVDSGGHVLLGTSSPHMVEDGHLCVVAGTGVADGTQLVAVPDATHVLTTSPWPGGSPAAAGTVSGGGMAGGGDTQDDPVGGPSSAALSSFSSAVQAAARAVIPGTRFELLVAEDELHARCVWTRQVPLPWGGRWCARANLPAAWSGGGPTSGFDAVRASGLGWGWPHANLDLARGVAEFPSRSLGWPTAECSMVLPGHEGGAALRLTAARRRSVPLPAASVWTIDRWRAFSWRRKHLVEVPRSGTGKR